MNSPGEVLGEVYAEELTCSTGVPSMVMHTGPPPEIHHQLLGLTDVQREVVVVTLVSQGVQLFSEG